MSIEITAILEAYEAAVERANDWKNKYRLRGYDLEELRAINEELVKENERLAAKVHGLEIEVATIAEMREHEEAAKKTEAPHD